MGWTLTLPKSELDTPTGTLANMTATQSGTL